LWKSVDPTQGIWVAASRPVNQPSIAKHLGGNLPPLESIHSISALKDVQNFLNSMQAIMKLVEKPVQIPVGLPQLCNLADGMQYSCVVLPAKFPADLRQRRGGKLLC